MRLGKRGFLGLSGLLSLALTSIVATDIYVDWQVEGKLLWSTVVENAIPLTLGVLAFATAYWVYAERESYLPTVTRWQYFAALGTLVVTGEVVALQMIQGELKPFLIVVQTTVGGVVVGTIVGLVNARAKAKETTIEAERDRFESLFENAPAEVVDAKLDGERLVVQRTNSSFEQMFDLMADDPVGDSLFDLVAHGDDIAPDMREAIRSESPLETTVSTPTETGPRHFQVRVIPYSEEGRAYVLYTDVTELRETQRELEQTVDQLERSNDRLQQFAYVTSHDLQEPLRMVSSYVSLLADEYEDELDEEADEYVEFAVNGADRMQDMIDGLLEYSRVRTQGEEFAETDASDVLETTLQDLTLLIDEHDVTVTHDDLPTVEADESQLGQVFQNLIENAVDHGSDGVAIHIGADRQDGEVVFSVSDDGPGIPESQQDRVFDIFEQGSRDDDGTGMGLAICDRIVSRHGGDIWVESSEGEGATFFFTMPAAE